ncbi:hypothetical protein BX591_11050 [Paraburkholderia bryophila]|uniref:Uncharacterized protein n=2 Tax=Paraburkholderia bryophila TaxID=420952 RepID=A0A329CF93_9BURK|nr:hypothetical protein BX591_11050 [Paraburkholderia bryophila]
MAKISRRKTIRHVEVKASLRPSSPRKPQPPQAPVYKMRLILPDSKGNYRLGPNDEYTLDAAGLEHILNGDRADQVIRREGHPTEVRKVLKGGLHTSEGWQSFKDLRKEVVHGTIFRGDRDTLWYFARELQNGVILLKIPRELFQSNAAKLTMSADVHYKSGYLWKTLFPKGVSASKIVSIIDEALFHLVEKESDDGLKIGYALLDDPFTAMKVRVQVTGRKINSAFPTWGQPSTGNNGKPYSHADAIGFPIAESTVFFGDKQDSYDITKTSLLGESVVTLAMLRSATPSLFLQRPQFSSESRDLELRSAWNGELENWATKASTFDIEALRRYLHDVVIIKDSFPLLLDCYGPAYPELVADHDFRMLTAFRQNQIDGFKAVAHYDKIHGTGMAREYAFLFLKSKFLRVGGLDTWEAKRFHVAILQWVISSDDPELCCSYLKALAVSPSRVAMYSDVDLNPYAAQDITIIGVTDPDVRVKPNHFIRFSGNQAALNYIIHFRPEERDRLAHAALEIYIKHYTEFLIEQIRHADVEDLTSFAWFSDELVEIIMKDPTKMDSDALRLVLHDYYRIIQIAQIRVVADNHVILQGGKNLPFNDAEFSGYWVYTKIKHQRDWLAAQVNIFFSEFKELCEAIGNGQLANICDSRMKNFYRDIIPTPEAVPSRFRRWASPKINRKMDASELIDVMFPRGEPR